MSSPNGYATHHGHIPVPSSPTPGAHAAPGWPNKWGSQIDTMLAQGRRNSAARIIQRIRSGSLTG